MVSREVTEVSYEKILLCNECNSFFTLFLITCNFDRQQDQIEKELNIDMSNGREISQSDDYGGFHNEGTSCIVYRFADDSALNQIRKDNYIFEG